MGSNLWLLVCVFGSIPGTSNLITFDCFSNQSNHSVRYFCVIYKSRYRVTLIFKQIAHTHYSLVCIQRVGPVQLYEKWETKWRWNEKEREKRGREEMRVLQVFGALFNAFLFPSLPLACLLLYHTHPISSFFPSLFQIIIPPFNNLTHYSAHTTHI